ncbi:protein ref(2)P [Culicoides brevitarsis]|uniref:protein ref(2)P n=1 Tax=Culicoides brevitarsis TaxID=469753 RepID=UPI00307C1760
MCDQTFKITVISANGQDKKESFYFNHFVDMVYPSLSQLKTKLFTKFGVSDANLHKNYKIYWIDEDGDEISIIDDDDLRILADRHQKSSPIKLNVRSIVENEQEEVKIAKEHATKENADCNANDDADDTLPAHPGVICDGCDNGIYGFRYKCVQCPDYDLCRRCEGKMIHENHMMVRIPIGAERLPRKIDRVLNLGAAFETVGENIRKFKHQESHHRREEEKHRREEEKHRRDEEKHRRHEEKCKRKAHRRCTREAHRASAAPQNGSGDAETQPRGPGFLYHVMDYLNYMMNPDNIMENLHQASNATAPQAENQTRGCPAMNLGFPIPPSCPRFQPDKATEAKEKAGISPEAATAADFESFLKTSVANAVALGTDANSMTTSIGVAAKEVEVQKENPEKEAEKPAEKPAEENLLEKIHEKLREMEQDVEKERKNRSNSPTISYASEDSDEGNGENVRDWTVLDNEEPVEGASAVENTETTQKETKKVEDKATLTENSSSASSSMFNSAHGNGEEQKETEKPKKPLTFAEMGQQLKAHIDEYRNLAVPVGPPASTSTTPINPNATEFVPGQYPHPYSAPKPKVYHPKPHINHAIHTMEAMGFSNDGGWLTNLLDTVDGNIPRALDLLQPHHK